LIVGDHQDSAAMYAIGLLAMGFQPLTANTAEEGFARACLFHPDVVVAYPVTLHNDEHPSQPFNRRRHPALTAVQVEEGTPTVELERGRSRTLTRTEHTYFIGNRHACLNAFLA
jgi:hypothetical protein